MSTPDDQFERFSALIEKQNELVMEQYDGLTRDLKDLSSTIHQFHLTSNTHDHEISNLKATNREVIARLDAHTESLRGLQQSLSDVMHGQIHTTQKVEYVQGRDEAIRNELGKVWEYINNLNVIITSTNTRISTSTAMICAVGGVLLSVMIAMVGYFGVLVIDDSKKIAVLESATKR